MPLQNFATGVLAEIIRRQPPIPGAHRLRLVGRGRAGARALDDGDADGSGAHGPRARSALGEGGRARPRHDPEADAAPARARERRKDRDGELIGARDGARGPRPGRELPCIRCTRSEPESRARDARDDAPDEFSHRLRRSHTHRQVPRRAEGASPPRSSARWSCVKRSAAPASIPPRSTSASWATSSRRGTARTPPGRRR